MTNHVIDNTLKNLGKTVLWQYDKAYRLLAVMKHLQVTFHVAVKDFWDYWIGKVLDIDNCGTLGATVWGMFLGIPRPTVKNEDGKTTRLVVTSVYRRILKGAFYLAKADSSMPSILGYLEIVFGVMGDGALGDWALKVSEYGWSAELEDPINKKRYEYDGRTGATTVIDDTTLKGNNVFLTLIDPENVKRKIGAASSDGTLVTVDYMLGGVKITATAERKRKCGVMLVDNGDMTMTCRKSQWWDELHRDQKALFEQRFDEFVPFPLGVGSGKVYGKYVLGLEEDMTSLYGGLFAVAQEYQIGRAYAKSVGSTNETSGSCFYTSGMYASLEDAILHYPYFCISAAKQYEGSISGLYNYIIGEGRLLSRGSSLSNIQSAFPDAEVVSWGDSRTRVIPVGKQMIFNWQETEYTDSTLSGLKSIYDKKVWFSLQSGTSISSAANVGLWKMFFAVNYKSEVSLRQENEKYSEGIAYARGAIFWYDEGDGGHNWACLEDISAEENTSFLSIRDKLTATNGGGPACDGLCEATPPYRNLHTYMFPITYETVSTENTGVNIPPNTLFCADRNGMTRIYKNTTGKYIFVVLHSMTDNNRFLMGVWNVIAYYMGDEWTIDSIMEKLGSIVDELGLREVAKDKAEQFMAGVQYFCGMCIRYEGEEFIFTEDFIGDSFEKARNRLIPQRKSGIFPAYQLA